MARKRKPAARKATKKVATRKMKQNPKPKTRAQQPPEPPSDFPRDHFTPGSI